MKKTNLILDPLQHSPGSYLLFDDCDYWTLFHPAVPEEPFYRDRAGFESFYNYKPTALADLAQEYERVFIVLPMYAVVGVDRPESFKQLLAVLYTIVDSKKPSRVAFFDSHDNPYLPLEFLDARGYRYDAIFKANYRQCALSTYTDKVKSFPYFCFGPIEPLWVSLTNEGKTPPKQERVSKCFWGAGAGGSFRAGSRPDIEPRVQEAISFDRDRYTGSPVLNDLLVKTPPLSHEDFMKGLRLHRSFLVLNGSGKVHRRFFEGVANGSLALLEKNDVIHPAEELEVWKHDDRCVFETPEELASLIGKIAWDEEFYEDRLKAQQKYKDTVLTKSWLSEYIKKNL